MDAHHYRIRQIIHCSDVRERSHLTSSRGVHLSAPILDRLVVHYIFVIAVYGGQHTRNKLIEHGPHHRHILRPDVIVHAFGVKNLRCEATSLEVVWYIMRRPVEAFVGVTNEGVCLIAGEAVDGVDVVRNETITSGSI